MFGGWTSASRKAMLPVVEGANGLLFYPVQYEGLEASQNIYYTGATTNQQIIPAMDFLAVAGREDAVPGRFGLRVPRTANKIIKQYADELGIEIVGEEYVPLDKRRLDHPGRQDRGGRARLRVQHDQRLVQRRLHQGVLRGRPRRRTTSPIISVSIAEEEAPAMGARPHRPVRRLELLPERRQPGQRRRSSRPSRPSTAADRPTSDPMEAAYTSLYLYKAMVEKAESFGVDAVNAAARRRDRSTAPGGRGHGRTARTTTSPRPGLIGQINAENQFDIVCKLRRSDRARSVPRDLQLVGRERRVTPGF